MSDTNGTARQSLKQIKAESQLLEAQTKLLQLRHYKDKLEKTAQLREHYYDGVWVRDASGLGSSALYDRVRGRTEYDLLLTPPSMASDRRHGDNWPIFRNEIELARIRNASRILSRYNSFARALLTNLTNYVVGKGFEYKAVSTDIVPDVDAQTPGKQDPDRVNRLEKVVQQWLTKWMKKTKWKQREREAFRRIMRDGEAFLRLFKLDSGLAVRPVEPEQVINPPGAMYTDGWSYGIQHQTTPDVDVETILQYHVVYKDLTEVFQKKTDTPIGEYVDAADVVHVKSPEEDSTVKRGLPSFYGDAGNALMRASDLMRNISAGAAARQAISMIWEYEFGNETQISSMLSAHREYEETDGITGNTRNIDRRHTGEIVHVPKGQQVGQHPGRDAGVGEHLQAVQGDVRLASSAFAAPEYITGDASNANYASSLVASAPFVRQAESLQEPLVEAFSFIIQEAIKYAIELGDLPQEALTLVEIQVTPPKVVHRDMVQQAVVDERLVMMGAKDRQTVAMEWGLDWETVKANNAEWEEIHGAYEETIPGFPRGGGGGAQTGAKAGTGGVGMGTGAGLPRIPGEGMRESWLREADSYFADCPRDEKGHCKSGGGESGGESQKPTRGQRANELFQKHQELRQARLDTFNSIKSEAAESLAAVDKIHDALHDDSGNMAWASEKEDENAVFSAYEDAVRSFDTGDDVATKFEALKEIEATARDAMAFKQEPIAETDDVAALTHEDIAANKAIFQRAIASSRAARQHLRQYADLRKEMKAVRSGSQLESLEECDETKLPECGGEGGKPGPCADGGADKPASSDVHAQAGEKAKGLLAKAASLPKAGYDKAVGAAKNLYAKMEAKVGPRWAKAIVATAIVTAPTPVMTGSILAMTGLAFAYTRLVSGGHIQASADVPDEPAEQELTDEQVKQLAAELLAELEKEMQ